MDWQILDLNASGEDVFLKTGTSNIISGMDKLKQQVAVRLLLGFKKTGAEYDAVSGGLGSLIRGRLEAEDLKMRIAILIDSVKDDIISSQVSVNLPDDELLRTLKAVRITATATTASIDVMVYNKADESGIISL